MRNNIRLAQLLIVMMIFFCGHALAQSTIFNIPTTDTVAKGKVYAEFDFMPQIPAPDGSRTYLYNPRVVIGAPHNVEFGVNLPIYNGTGSGAVTNAYIQPNAKWKFYDNSKSGVALAVGGVLNTPLNHTDSQDSWGYLYGLLSKKFKGDYGPRFHVGGYGVISNDKGTAFLGDDHGGAILGYEQPISKKVSIVADWFSQKNSLGYFTPGISITVPGNGLLNAGYCIGNDSWKNVNGSRNNRFLFVYYGVTF